jgi:hypothetical protein
VSISLGLVWYLSIWRLPKPSKLEGGGVPVGVGIPNEEEEDGLDDGRRYSLGCDMVG